MRHIPITFFVLLLSATLVSAHGDEDEYHGVKCGFPDVLRRLKSGVGIQSLRNPMQHIHRSASGNFAVHYDRTGVHAVPTEDNNGNGVPDFVDSTAVFLDRSYEVEIAEIGYRPLPPDQNQSGTAEYDVYLQDVGQQSGTYGYTYPDQLWLGQGGTDGRYTSYIVIDNNFSVNDRYNDRRVFYETGYRALKVTVAHELHHAIQIGAYGRSDDFRILHEMTSTWMEYRVFPEVRDYRQYLPRLFGNLAERSLGATGDPSPGYDYGFPLGQFLYKSFGDEFLLDMWKRIGDRENPYSAFANAFADNSSSFNQEWCRFATWFYYTGHRAQDNTYFDPAAEFPLVNFNTVKTFTPPSLMFSGTMRPLELRFSRIILPREDGATADTVDIGLANINIGAAALRTSTPSLYEIVCSREPGGMAIPGTSYFLTLNNTDNNICFVPPVVNSGFVIRAGSPFPNPCFPVEGPMFFPVPESAGEGAQITLTVFDAAMLPVFSKTTSYKVVNRSRVIEWDCRTDNGQTAVDGVYIYTTECDGSVNMGKVAIINK